MSVRMIRLVSVFVLFSVFAGGVTGAQPSEIRLDVSAMGRDRNGRHFAIVRGHGVVEEGDIITVSTPELCSKLRILSIGPAGLKTQALEIVRKDTRPKPEPDSPKQNGIGALRDPFSPVGYKAES